MLHQFFQGRLPQGVRLLLAFSGGTDSLALLHLFWEEGLPLELHVAHVDHGWREESAQEALLLEEHVRRLKLPFHLLKLGKPQEKSEEEAREWRYEALGQLYHELQAEALLLAHQADEQAETILKRLFEGASLIHLSAMKEDESRHGMRILRPLLTRRKRDLLAFLEERKLEALDDPANRDPRYLRARLRHELIPTLETHFGKEVVPPLLRLGERARELEAYLERRLPREETELLVDLDEKPLERVEVEFLLRRRLKEEGIIPSFDVVQRAINLLFEKASHRTLPLPRGQLFLDKGKAILLS